MYNRKNKRQVKSELTKWPNLNLRRSTETESLHSRSDPIFHIYPEHRKKKNSNRFTIFSDACGKIIKCKGNPNKNLNKIIQTIILIFLRERLRISKIFKNIRRNFSQFQNRKGNLLNREIYDYCRLLKRLMGTLMYRNLNNCDWDLEDFAIRIHY